jgi:hypothetical protein
MMSVFNSEPGLARKQPWEWKVMDFVIFLLFLGTGSYNVTWKRVYGRRATFGIRVIDIA